ncbi:MAG: dihydrofolate reductase family protein [Nocardioides sp.]
MRKVVLYSLLSLDGVAESPDEYVHEFDDQMLENLTAVIATQDAVVLGRVSYEEWAAYWPTSDDEPFASFINDVDKYVVTSTPLTTPWRGSTAVHGTPASLIADLRERPGGDIGVHASVTLSRSLLDDGLVDELRLVVAPTVAGTGRRLLGDNDTHTRLQLVDAVGTPSGALLLTYGVAP